MPPVLVESILAPFGFIRRAAPINGTAPKSGRLGGAWWEALIWLRTTTVLGVACSMGLHFSIGVDPHFPLHRLRLPSRRTTPPETLPLKPEGHLSKHSSSATFAEQLHHTPDIISAVAGDGQTPSKAFTSRAVSTDIPSGTSSSPGWPQCL